MSQHGYMRHMATPPLVLDLIRLIQSRAEKVDCFTIITFHLLWETIFYGHYRSILNHSDIIGRKIYQIR